MMSGISEKIKFKSSDGIDLSANFYPVENLSGWFILVHMMPAVKESWDFFAREMQNSGYSSLALDLRGHGESGGGPSGYEKFNDEDHQRSIFDLEAAWKFLGDQGAIPGKTILAGASIGANLVLQYLSEHHEFKKGILLSAGSDYRGIRTAEISKKLGFDQEIFLVSSRDDGDNLFENKNLYKSIRERSSVQMLSLDSGGHGTDMLSPGTIDSIMEFIKYGTVK